MEKEFENYNQEQSTDQSSEKHEGHQTQPSSYQRQFRPDDPVIYDYALFGIGVTNAMPKS